MDAVQSAPTTPETSFLESPPLGGVESEMDSSQSFSEHHVISTSNSLWDALPFSLPSFWKLPSKENEDKGLSDQLPLEQEEEKVSPPTVAVDVGLTQNKGELPEPQTQWDSIAEPPPLPVLTKRKRRQDVVVDDRVINVLLDSPLPPFSERKVKSMGIVEEKATLKNSSDEEQDVMEEFGRLFGLRKESEEIVIPRKSSSVDSGLDLMDFPAAQVDRFDINGVPEDLIPGFCRSLFDRDTCPSKELEKYVVRLHRLRERKGDRKWSPEEHGTWIAVRMNLSTLVQLGAMKYHHHALKMAYLDAVEGGFRAVEILVDTHSEREALLKANELKMAE